MANSSGRQTKGLKVLLDWRVDKLGRLRIAHPGISYEEVVSAARETEGRQLTHKKKDPKHPSVAWLNRRLVETIDRILWTRQQERMKLECEQRRARIDLGQRVRPPVEESFRELFNREVLELREPAGFVYDHPDHAAMAPPSVTGMIYPESFRTLTDRQKYRRFSRD